MTDEEGAAAKTLPAGLPASKRASSIFLIVFALTAYIAVRAPDYSGIPVPGAPVPPAAAVRAPALVLAQDKPLPADTTALAAAALNIARQWRPDAVLVQIDVELSALYMPVFSFISPADNTRLDVRGRDRVMTTTALPADPGAPSKPIILRFIDLPTAVNFAKLRGMTGELRSAILRVAPNSQALVWTIQPDTNGHAYYVDGITGLPTGSPAGDPAGAPAP